MKRKGFTLVEMLAVVAILGILVIIVLPNVLKNYRDAKRVAFIDEAKTVYSKATDKYVLERTKGNKIGLLSNEKNTLDLTNAEDLQYTVRIDSDGRVTAFRLANSEFCIIGIGDFLNGYTKEDVIDMTDEEEAASCELASIAEGELLTVNFGKDLGTSGEYSPNPVYLIYGKGWSKSKSNSRITEVSVPSKENQYYEGAYVKNIDGLVVRMLNCDGSIAPDETGGGIFTGREERKTITARSKFIQKYYTLKFNGGAGITVTDSTITCNYGASGCKIPETGATRVGYTFQGWSKTEGSNIVDFTVGQELPTITDSNEYDSDTSYFRFNNEDVCRKQVNDDVAVDNSKNLYPVWNAKEYTIAYELDGGTGGTNSPTSGKYDDVLLISNPSKKVKVTFDAGTSGASIDYTGAAANNSEHSYTFNGWTSSAAKGLSTSTAKTGTTNNPTTAWNGSAIKNEYFKNLRTDPGVVTLLATWGQPTIKLPKVTKDGYTCKWKNGSNTWNSGANYSPSATAGVTQISFSVNCTANVYTITLDHNGGTNSINSIYEKYGEGWYSSSAASGTAITKISAAPTQSGKTFTGYFDGTTRVIKSDRTIEASNTKYTADKTVSAKWCTSCATVSNGSCSEVIQSNGSCKYDTSCDSGYSLQSGSETASPKCCKNCDSVSNGTCSVAWSNNKCTYTTLCDAGYELKSGSGTASPKCCQSCVSPVSNGTCSVAWTNNACKYTTSCNSGYSLKAGSGTRDPKCCKNCETVSNGSCTVTWENNTCKYTTTCDDGYTLVSGDGTSAPKCCRNCNTVTGGTCTVTWENNACKYTTSCASGYTIGNSGSYNYTCTPDRTFAFKYTGTYTVVSGTHTKSGDVETFTSTNWVVKLKTGGTLTTYGSTNASLYLVGGGAGGNGGGEDRYLRVTYGEGHSYGGKGGGGGSRVTKNVTFTDNGSYVVTIGSGGTGGPFNRQAGTAGGATTITNCTDCTANGGTVGGGGKGGEARSTDASSVINAGNGVTGTCPYNDCDIENVKLGSSGGGGAAYCAYWGGTAGTGGTNAGNGGTSVNCTINAGGNGVANTGGGGGGGGGIQYYRDTCSTGKEGGNGGTGVVYIKNR